MKVNNKAIYLKINRKDNFALKNLSRWMDAAYLIKADCYIVCDDEGLKREIEERLLIYYPITFLKSEKCDELKFIVDNIAKRNWKNAAYAHLTTFLNARELGYDFFWNIDADDTRLCTSISKMVEILQLVEDYTEKNKIDCISLDMWRSQMLAKHWSFGITYVNGNKDWIKLCSEKCEDSEYDHMETVGGKNVDWFFTYLKDQINWKIETFYVENLRFIHYSNDMIERPIESGIYHWKDGKLIYPLIYNGFGSSDLGKYNIADDVIKIDANVSDCEAENFLAYYARVGRDLGKYIDSEKIIDSKIFKRKFNVFKEKHGFSDKDKPEIICFGISNELKSHIKKLKKNYDIKYVCDNAQERWGETLAEGVKCISPQDLAKMGNIIVIISVYSKNNVKQISEQLNNMHLEYDNMDKLLLCVE